MKSIVLITALLFSLTVFAQDTIAKQKPDSLLHVKMLSLADVYKINETLSKQLLAEDWLKVVNVINNIYYQRRDAFIKQKTPKKKPD